MVAKKKSTKKLTPTATLQKKVKALECLLRKEKVTSRNLEHKIVQRDVHVDSLIALEDDKLRIIQKEERAAKRRSNAAASLLKSVSACNAEIIILLALGLIENKPLVDVAEGLFKGTNLLQESLLKGTNLLHEVVLVNYSDKKTNVIKAIRAEFFIGLKEAKELVERTPVVLCRVPASEAEEIALRLRNGGIGIQIR